MMANLKDALSTFADRDFRDPDAFPSASVAELFEMGIIQAPLPAALGGSDASAVDAVDIIQAIASASGSLALIACMPLGLASIFAISPDSVPAAFRESWRSQADFAAAEYRQGHIYAACNSEKGAGGSLAATKTMATRRADGTFSLSGDKILATGGRFSTHFFSTAKVSQEDLPGAGTVEFFIVPAAGSGVEILDDWDGFGMRSSESQSVRYSDAAASSILGFPNFIDILQPIVYFHLLFAAVPLGCAGAILRELTTPSPQSPALRLRFNEALMRYESLQAYLRETAAALHPAGDAALRSRVLRAKTYVSQEATKLAAELFALSGGRSYRRDGVVAKSLRDSFAGTALRPPLSLGLEMLSDSFAFEPLT